MRPVVNNPPADCPGHCDQCGLAGNDVLSVGDPSVQGGVMVVCSAAVFILPLVMAAVGAFLGRKTALVQVGGALSGFAMGVLLAKGITVLLKIRETK